MVKSSTELRTMKSLALIIFAAVFVSAQASNEEAVKDFSDTCSEVTGVDSSIVEKARTGHFTDDEKYIKYCHCVSKKLEVIDDEGHFDQDKMIGMMPANHANANSIEILKKCVQEANGEAIKEHRAFVYYKCFVTAIGNPVYSFKN